MFSNRFARMLALAVLLAPALAAQVPSASDPPRYVLPPKEIVEAFDAPPPPLVLVSPSRQVIAEESRTAHPTIAELAQPMLRLAGSRISPKSNGPRLPGNVYAIALERIADGAEVKVAVPPQAKLSNIRFSPDGAHLSFTHTKENGIELWVADTATGSAKLVSGTDRINATTGDPCDWLRDNATLVCQTVPAGRGPAPAEPLVPGGPNVQENFGKAAPAPTYEDLLKTVHDDALFEYYFTSQLVSYDTATGRRATIGSPAILANVTPAPGGEYILVSRIKRPFSHLIPMNGFPEDVEIWTRRGEVARKIADRPSREGTPLTGVEPGPRSAHWRADQPATLVWIEALDGGNPKTKVPFRDKVMSLGAPFTAEPAEVARTEWRLGGISYAEKGVALVTESDRVSHRTRTWIVEAGAAPRKLGDRKRESAYDNPGTPVARRDSGDSGFAGGGGGRGGPAGSSAIIQNGD